MAKIHLLDGRFLITQEPVDAIMHQMNRAVPIKGVNGPVRVAGYATVSDTANGKRRIVFKHAISTMEED